MSCIMSNQKALQALANATSRALHYGYDFHGYEVPDELRKALWGCREGSRLYDERLVYGALYYLNEAAYNGRDAHNAEALAERGGYADPGDPSDWPVLVRRVEWEDGLRQVQPGHYHLMKLLDFYLYQVSEDATRNHPLTKALELWADRLRCFIVENTVEYATLGWGEV